MNRPLKKLLLYTGAMAFAGCLTAYSFHLKDRNPLPEHLRQLPRVTIKEIQNNRTKYLDQRVWVRAYWNYHMEDGHYLTDNRSGSWEDMISTLDENVTIDLHGKKALPPWWGRPTYGRVDVYGTYSRGWRDYSLLGRILRDRIEPELIIVSEVVSGDDQRQDL